MSETMRSAEILREIDLKLIDARKIKRLEKLEERLNSLELEKKAEFNNLQTQTMIVAKRRKLHKKYQANIKALEKLADVKQCQFFKELNNFMHELDYDQIDTMLKNKSNLLVLSSLGFLRKTMTWLTDETPSYESQRQIEKSVLKCMQSFHQMELVPIDFNQPRILGFASNQVQQSLISLAEEYEHNFPLSAVNQVKE